MQEAGIKRKVLAQIRGVFFAVASRNIATDKRQKRTIEIMAQYAY